jgi:LmbE family N-acetylglucosaminyl deacetylase
MSIPRKPALAIDLAGLRSGKRVIFVSPHYDDAGFSCAGTIRRLRDLGLQVLWVTVFSAGRPSPTGFALECQTSKGIAPDRDYMELRRQEDLACARVLGVGRPLTLDLLEAPHRGYDSPAALFSERRLCDRTTERRIAEGISQLLRRLRPAAVWAPMGLGDHVDHRLVRSACLRVASIQKTRLFLYPENPYLLRNPDLTLPWAGAGLRDIYFTDVRRLASLRARGVRRLRIATRLPVARHRRRP